MVATRLPLPVHCLNCGGGGSDWVALTSVIIAVLALLVALRALHVARKEHQITVEEHTEFMRQLSARARFDLTGDVVRNRSRPFLSTAGGESMRTVVVQIGVTNKGEKAATHTTVNVLAPQSVENLAWCDAKGEPDPGSPSPAQTSDTLRTAEGDEECLWLSKEIARVSLRSPIVSWFTFDAPVGTRVPVRIKADSDDLPDEVPESVIDRVIDLRATDEAHRVDE